MGDTFVLGCAFPKCIVFYDSLKDNPDFDTEEFKGEIGIYEKNCGLENVSVIWS